MIKEVRPQGVERQAYVRFGMGNIYNDSIGLEYDEDKFVNWAFPHEPNSPQVFNLSGWCIPEQVANSGTFMFILFNHREGRIYKAELKKTEDEGLFELVGADATMVISDYFN